MLDEKALSGCVFESSTVIPLKFYWYKLGNIVYVSSDGIDVDVCGINNDYPCFTLNYGILRSHNSIYDTKIISVMSERLAVLSSVLISDDRLKLCGPSSISTELFESGPVFIIKKETVVEHFHFLLEPSYSYPFFEIFESFILESCSFIPNFSYFISLFLFPFISHVSGNSNITISNTLFSNITLTVGNGSILNAIINSGCLLNISNSSFLYCSVTEANGQGGGIYIKILNGGMFRLDGKNSQVTHTFEGCSAPLDTNGRGGAITLVLDNEILDSDFYGRIYYFKFLYFFFFLL
jgi:hypothetical protein